MLCSIEIESLRDIPFPDRGIDINRIGNFTHFQITLGEGLILIRMINMYEEKIDHLIKCKKCPNTSVMSSSLQYFKRLFWVSFEINSVSIILCLFLSRFHQPNEGYPLL